MKILLVNSHHQIIGGAERYYFDLAALLAKKGHRVAFFSTTDNKNAKSKFSKYFIGKLNFKTKSLKNSFNKFPKIFFNYEARYKISKLLDDFKPDIVHIQNSYYYISSSILKPIKKRGIPIVQTLHDFQTISPNVVMYHDGRICEISKKNRFYNSVIHRCVKKSYMASLMAVVTLYFQNYFSKYQFQISKFITPSNFVKKKLAEYSYAKGKTVYLQNFLSRSFLNKPKKTIPGKYALYYGRICDAKGMYILLKAAAIIPDIPIVFAGNFEDEKTRRDFFAIKKSLQLKNVNLKNFRTGNMLKKLIVGSRFTILPSVWYENQPYSIMESMALGIPVIASNSGGIPEILPDKKAGLIVAPGDAKKLAAAIKRLWNNPKRLRRMSAYAEKYAIHNFSADSHYRKLISIYTDCLASTKK